VARLVSIVDFLIHATSELGYNVAARNHR